MRHSVQVFVGGNTHAPGLFGWRCSCGSGAKNPEGTFQSWDDAERAAYAHKEEAEADQ